jgi:hypothetical protein
MSIYSIRLLRVFFAGLFIVLVYPALTQAQQFGFRVYDASGREIRWERFRQIEENWKAIEGSGDTERPGLCSACKGGNGCSCHDVCDKKAGDVDVLLHPSDLSVIFEGGKVYTLDSSHGNDGFPTFEWPGDNPMVSLAVAWPTSGGYYSTVILDIQRRDERHEFWETVRERGEDFLVFNFNLVAAREAVESLEQMLRKRTDQVSSGADNFEVVYHPSASFTQQFEQSKRLLDQALRATNPNDKGKWGAQAFDAAVAATLTLLREYGVQYARARKADPHLKPSRTPQWGVTFELDDPSHDMTDAVRSVSRMLENSQEDGWIRLIFSKDDPKAYMPLIKKAHELGLHVLGQLRDSKSISGIHRLDWQRYVRNYVDTLSNTKRGEWLIDGEVIARPGECNVDEWEVGNEVNGEWVVKSDPDGILRSGEYIDYALGYIKQDQSRRVLLTLYWQIGNFEDRKFSMFEWLQQTFKDPKMPLYNKQSQFDDIGVSLYPDKTPMGIAFDRVIETLRDFFPDPHQRIMITELGYWPERSSESICEYGHIWRLGGIPKVADRDADRDRMRGEVAQFYQAATMGYPYTGGGPYWWYYLQERGSEQVPGAVWSTLHSLHATINTVAPGNELKQKR